eukprot:2880696-Lingulodinium_polyedra.AAC.1
MTTSMPSRTTLQEGTALPKSSTSRTLRRRFSVPGRRGIESLRSRILARWSTIAAARRGAEIRLPM